MENAGANGRESIEETVRRLAAESDAGQVVLRYARGLDRRGFDLVRDCFEPDAGVEGTSFGGPPRTYLPRLLDGVAAYPRTALDGRRATRRSVAKNSTNRLVDTRAAAG